jgi:hypothetical protein
LAITSSVGRLISGLNWQASPAQNPVTGDCYFDQSQNRAFIWQGSAWIGFSAADGEMATFTVPTSAQLEKHPSLKAAWEEFLVIKKLLGV